MSAAWYERRPIAVYGTLRSGNGNARLWHGHATSRGTGYIIGYALVTNGGFPYAVRAATAQSVVEVIVPHVDDYDYVLGRMDALEGYRPGSQHNHYDRVTVPVFVEGNIVTAWIYVPAWMDDHVSNLPDVATNDDGRYDWACQTPRRSIINR